MFWKENMQDGKNKEYNSISTNLEFFVIFPIENVGKLIEKLLYIETNVQINDMESIKNNIFQFHVGYMTSPMLKEYGTLLYQVTKTIDSTFHISTVNSTKKLLIKSVNVITLIMFYGHRKQLCSKC